MNSYEKAAHTLAARRARWRKEEWVVCRDQCREDCEPQAFFATTYDHYLNSPLDEQSCEILAVYGPQGRLPDDD